MNTDWQDGFTIKVNIDNNTTVISANKEGLRSLSGIIKALAEEEPGSHLHLDEHNSLEDGSAELIIQIVECE